LLHGNADRWLPPTVRPDPSTLLRTEGLVEGLGVVRHAHHERVGLLSLCRSRGSTVEFSLCKS
jgi:hypothetical protein